jgi:ribonuclease P protein component
MNRPSDGETVPDREADAPRPVAARLKKRADFLAAAKGRRQHQRCFVLQARQRPPAGPSDPAPLAAAPFALESEIAPAARFGFTVTKKVGNAVIRNRIRRRLREAVRLADFSLSKASHDYVLVARIEALTAPFDELRGEIARALTRIHQTGPDRRPPASPAADRKQDV